MSTRQKMCILFLGLSLCVAALSTSAQEISNGIVRVKAVLEDGKAVGFDVFVKGKLLCPIRFCSNGILKASYVKKQVDSIVFSRLSFTSGGTVLGKGSFVEVQLKKDDPYPEVSFRLDIEKFSEGRWRKDVGKVPFHFLIMPIEEAEVVHHRGWIVATPVLDPYPLLRGRQNIVCSGWSRSWMWAPPFGACPLPVAGLWTPRGRRYVAYDFTLARLTDHTEKYVASSYCWHQKGEKNFITLVYPFAREYIMDVRYPKENSSIASHFTLIYSLDMPYWGDPNTFYQEYIWSRYRDLLPGSPVINDLSYFPGQFQYRNFPPPGEVVLTYKVPEKDEWESHFFEKDTIIPRYGPVGQFPIDLYYKRNLKRLIEGVKKQFSYLLEKAKRFEYNGEKCVYWEKPIEGKGKRKWIFGDVTTLRQIHGWGIANVFLDVYRHEKNPEYLEVVEGVLNWTKYNICTRNDISDVPEAMFTYSGPGICFCLNYYYTFRDDPKRKERAEMALELARKLVYRYLTIFIADTDEDDNIDGTFLIEPTSGRPWTGMACSNECSMIPVGMLYAYVATGDPLIRHYLTGMTERWSLLYQAIYAPTIKKHPPMFTECYGLFDECAIGGKGKRATYGALAAIWPANVFPVGEAKARVICGEKAAIAFNREGMHTDISEYRCSKGLKDGMSFRINSTLKGTFDLAISCPYFDLYDKDFFIKRGGELKKLEKGKDYKVRKNTFWSAYIFKVQDGDIIAVGKLNERLPVIKCEATKPQTLKSRSFENEGFKIIDLSRHCNYVVNFSWDDSTSYAPYLAGEHYAYGIPYFFIPAYLAANKVCVKDAEIPLDVSAEHIFLLAAELNDKSSFTITYGDGEKEEIPLTFKKLAWKGWPLLFQCSIDIIGHRCRGKNMKSLSVKNALLFGITTSLPSGKERAEGYFLKFEEEKRRAQKRKKWEEKRKRLAREREKSLKKGYALQLKADYAKRDDYEYVYLYIAKGKYTIPDRDDVFLEYDILIPLESAGFQGGVDLTGGSLGNLRGQPRLGAHPDEA